MCLNNEAYVVPSSISKDPFIYAHGEVGNFSPTLLVEVEIVILKYITLSTSLSLVQREKENPHVLARLAEAGWDGARTWDTYA
jgi:hypothetical protein